MSFFAGVGVFLGLGGLGAKFLEFLYPVVPPTRFEDIVVAKREQILPNGALAVHLNQGHIILLDRNGTLKAFSAVCTHLGCLVHWEAEKNRFFCPCHRGTYAPDGTLISGPPPRPLEEYQVKIEKENVVVRMKVSSELT